VENLRDKNSFATLPSGLLRPPT